MVYALNVPEKICLFLTSTAAENQPTINNTLNYQWYRSAQILEQGGAKHRRKAYHSQLNVPRTTLGASLINRASE